MLEVCWTPTLASRNKIGLLAASFSLAPAQVGATLHNHPPRDLARFGYLWPLRAPKGSAAAYITGSPKHIKYVNPVSISHNLGPVRILLLFLFGNLAPLLNIDHRFYNVGLVYGYVPSKRYGLCSHCSRWGVTSRLRPSVNLAMHTVA